jgi:cyanophycinase
MIRTSLLFFYLSVALTPYVSAQSTAVPRGQLFIIGGGDISDSLRREMLDAAHWGKGDLIAGVTLASNWDSSFFYINEAFSRLTGQTCIHIDSAALHRRSAMDSLRRAKLIYLGGGDQALFMDRISGTGFLTFLRSYYAGGGTVAGTSAGASVMSRMMLTGNSNRGDGSSTSLKGLWSGSVDFREGLGLLDSVIIDQHFVVRSRYNRMLSTIMDLPRYQYIAINESTAILVRDELARVYGVSQVIVSEAPSGIKRTAQGDLGAEGICLSIYLPGDTFYIRR